MRAISVPLVFLFALLFSWPAAPASIGLTWQGPDGNWTDSRWADSGGTVGYYPNNGSDTYQATIPGTSVSLSTLVTVDTLNLTGGQLTLASGGTLFLAQPGSTNSAALVLSGGTLMASASFTNSGAITSGSGGTLVLGSGTVTNSGAIQQISGSNAIQVMGAATLAGGGNVLLNGGVAAFGGAPLINADNTISGTGYIDGALYNQTQGVVRASGGILSLNFAGGGGNGGIMEASSGSRLEIYSGGITLANTGGTIQALDGSTVRITSPVLGGNLKTVGTGALELASMFSEIAITNSTAGRISLSGTTLLDGASTLTNAGTLNIGGGNALQLMPGSTMENSGAVNIATAGVLALGGIGVNSGTIAVSDGTFALAGNLSNSGTIQLDAASSRMEVLAPSALSGTGSVVLAGGTINAGLGLTNAGNTIEGFGTINGVLNNQGMVRASGGTLSLNFAGGGGNGGMMEASGGSRLEIYSGGITLANTGGTIQALDGSTVRITSPVLGGNLKTVGSGALELASMFSDIAITNSTAGTISLSGTTLLDGASTLTNAGRLNIGGGNALQLMPGSTMENSGAVNIATSGMLAIGGLGVNSGTIAVSDGTFAWAGNLSNSGTIQLDAASSRMEVLAPSALSGTGSVVLAGGTINAGLGLTNAGNTIEGFGTINGVLNNQGMVRASGGTLTLNFAGGGGNGGMMEASGGSRLEIYSGGITLANTGGTIQALDGSTVRITSPVLGGNLKTVGSGALELASMFSDIAITNSTAGTISLSGTTLLDGASTLTNAGRLNIGGGNALQSMPGSTMENSGAVNIATAGMLALGGIGVNSGTIAVSDGTFAWAGNLSNSGTIQLDAASSRMEVLAPSALSGTGSVVLAGGTINAGLGLTNAGNTIEGFGTINGVLNNQGVVRASGGTLRIDDLTNLSVNTLTGGTYYVAGTLELLGATSIWDLDAHLTLDGPAALIKNGTGGDALGSFRTIKSGGALALLNGAMIASDLTNYGLLSGNGTVNGTLFDSGVLSPGMSPGMLTIDGYYTQNPGGVLNMEIGGGNPGEFDQLIVTLLADFNGTLNISLLNGFRPYHGQEFMILSFDGVGDRFSAVNGLDYGPGVGFVMDWHATDLTLRWQTPEPGTWLLAAAGLALLALRTRRR